MISLSLQLTILFTLFFFALPLQAEGEEPNDGSPPSSQTLTPLSSVDHRDETRLRNLNTLRSFPVVKNLKEWEKRKADIQLQIKISCGLFPMPTRPDLKAHISGKVIRDGYSVEKVSIQTYEGSYLCGNLYRPTKANASKRPSILVAHGHWNEGRMANNEEGSIPARAITFARQGYVAFTYDMAGYNDTKQIDHRSFATSDAQWLWGISLMGLQTWNSIRALDFLCALTDVDKKNVGITGESGGGTQTMILAAIDDRIKFTAPCVMVSHSMQGGCLCENAPGLRIDFSNMEIAAAAAPKPQIMIGATGDWTKTMLTTEGPAVESVYALYDKPDSLKYELFPFNHNINKTSREAVYRFFGDKILHEKNASTFSEPPFEMEPISELRVFPDGVALPSDAKSPRSLYDSLITDAKSSLENTLPTNRESLKSFQRQFHPAWLRTLALEIPTNATLRSSEGVVLVRSGYSQRDFHLGRSERGDSIPARLLVPSKPTGIGVVMIHPEGSSAFFVADGEPSELLKLTLSKGVTVLLIDTFLTGTRKSASVQHARNQPFGEFFTTYNRTELQERLQDVVTGGAWLRTLPGVRTIKLAGIGKAGLWAVLVAPAFDGVVADCETFDTSEDASLLTSEMYIPCLRKLGDFQTSAVLATPSPLLLHNTGEKNATWDKIKQVYQRVEANSSFASHRNLLSPNAISVWLTEGAK